MRISWHDDEAPAEPPIYEGLAGLAAADPAELAARAFVRVFSAGQPPHYRPEAVLGILQQFAGLNEIPGATVRGIMTSPGARYSLDPLYLQCVLLWERGLLAGRLSRGDSHHHVVLLPRGWRALTEAKPYDTVLEILNGDAQRDSS